MIHRTSVSRSVVGWSIEQEELDEHSARLFARVTRHLNVRPKIVHADSGHPMRGVTLAVFRRSRDGAFPRVAHPNVIFSPSLHDCDAFAPYAGTPPLNNLPIKSGTYSEFCVQHTARRADDLNFCAMVQVMLKLTTLIPLQHCSLRGPVPRQNDMLLASPFWYRQCVRKGVQKNKHPVQMGTAY